MEGESWDEGTRDSDLPSPGGCAQWLFRGTEKGGEEEGRRKERIK